MRWALGAGVLFWLLVPVIIDGVRRQGRRILRAVGEALVYLVGSVAFLSVAFWGVGALIMVLVVGSIINTIIDWVPWLMLGSGLLLVGLGAWVVGGIRQLIWLPLRNARRKVSANPKDARPDR